MGKRPWHLPKNLTVALPSLRLLPAVSPGFTAALVGLVLLGASIPVGVNVASARLIGALPKAISEGLSSSSGSRLLQSLAIVAGLFVFQYAVGPITGAVTGTLSRRLDGLIRERVMRSAVEPAGIAHLEDPSVLDRISIAKGAAGYTPGGAVAPLAYRTSSYIQGVLYAAILTQFRWWLGVALLGSWILARRTGIRNFREIAKIYTGHSQKLRRTGYYSDLALRPAASKEIRVFGLHDWIRDRYSDHWLEVMKDVWRERKRLVTEFLWPSLLVWLVLFLGVASVAMDGVRGALSLGEIALYLLAMSGMSIFLMLRIEDLSIAFGFESVPVALGLDTEIRAALLDGGSIDPSDHPREQIRFENVTFRYPGQETEVLSGLNLTIDARESHAIVGLNGAGKTTLVKLLCRLYDPTSGRITADGIDIREFPPHEWQNRIRAIFQDFVRFELSAADNVAFGDLENLGNTAALERAASLAGAGRLVEKLPLGWDTILSRRYANGADLSGGEWQKIALARALFAVGGTPRILVLDEPTANLDVRAETEIYTTLLEATRNQTVILISHRFSTVRRASKICVLEGGRIIEQGTHDELVPRHGRYAEMFRLQAAQFAMDEDEVTS